MSGIVKTLQGDVKGARKVDLDGNHFYEFLGIPYAKPPVGDLRFKECQPVENWIGVNDATIESDCCYHKDPLTKQYKGSEDCLTLNVFTRELPEESGSLKPVMVWIHGGAFLSGSNTTKIYGPEFLLTEDVVLVSINYRLGILGYLCLKDKTLSVSGNMGFKDQVAALRWVKSNIVQFNGDPNNVTIFGESAGSASVHYHILSPLSSGLFHKAILQSGVALNPWADNSSHNAVTIARLKDRNVDTEAEALAYLKGISVEELLSLQEEYVEQIENNAIRPFGLVIEGNHKTSFMPRSPIDIIVSGEYNKVPIIIGYNNREGILFNAFSKMTDSVANAQPEDFIPYNVNFKSNVALKRSYVEKLRNLYFRGESQDDNHISIIGDAWFVVGIIGAVRNHAQTSPFPIYLYKLSLDTKLNALKMITNCTDVPGCSHGDDVGYLFKTEITPPIEPDTIEAVSLRRILKLWTNFATYGNPTPEESELGLIWKPVKARQLYTLNIAEDLTLEINTDARRVDLWKEMYSQSPATSKYL